MTDDMILGIALLCLLVFTGGIAVGDALTRHDWIKACRKRKLVRFSAKSGKLVFACDRSAIP